MFAGSFHVFSDKVTGAVYEERKKMRNSRKSSNLHNIIYFFTGNESSTALKLFWVQYWTMRSRYLPTSMYQKETNGLVSLFLFGDQ